MIDELVLQDEIDVAVVTKSAGGDVSIPARRVHDLPEQAHTRGRAGVLGAVVGALVPGVGAAAVLAGAGLAAVGTGTAQATHDQHIKSRLRDFGHESLDDGEAAICASVPVDQIVALNEVLTRTTKVLDLDLPDDLDKPF